MNHTPTFTPRIAVVSAGVHTPSASDRLAAQLADAVVELLPGAAVQHVALRDLAPDLAVTMAGGAASSPLAEALGTVTGADALIAVTPVMTMSYSALFKAFFDALDPRALVGTPTLVGATGGSLRHAMVLESAIRPMFAYLRTYTAPTAVFATYLDEGSPELQSRIARAAGELAELVTMRTHAAESPTPRVE